MNREFEDRPRREDGPRREERSPRHHRSDDGRRPEGGRPPHPRFEGKPGMPERPERPERFHRPRRPKMKQVTKMFTSKADLVEYVNIEGEKGHKIDVYKIEDNLYKVVKIDRPEDGEVR